jgi:acetoacetate decarboxylase
LGYSPPLSPTGSASIVLPPPWYFGTEGIHVRLEADAEAFRNHLPEPLRPSDEPNLIEVVFREMSTVSGAAPEQHVDHPEVTNFRECLIRMSCTFEGKKGWYIPYSWVDNDTALVRGLIQGFPKKIASLHLTRFSEANPKVGGRRRGARLGARLTAPNGLSLKATQTCEAERDPKSFPNEPLFLLRQFPGVETGSGPALLDIVQPIVTDAVRRDVWVGPAELEISGPDVEELRLLANPRFLESWSLISSFTITGGRILYRYPVTPTAAGTAAR